MADDRHGYCYSRISEPACLLTCMNLDPNPHLPPVMCAHGRQGERPWILQFLEGCLA